MAIAVDHARVKVDNVRICDTKGLYTHLKDATRAILYGEKPTPRKRKPTDKAKKTEKKKEVASKLTENILQDIANAFVYGQSPQEATLGSQLSSMGLAVKKVQGDGNCLFHSLKDQVFGSTRVSAATVRDDVTNHVLKHAARYAELVPQFVTADGLKRSQSKEEYIKERATQMKNPAVWGTELEIYAMANMTGSKITIVVDGYKSDGTPHPFIDEKGVTIEGIEETKYSNAVNNTDGSKRTLTIVAYTNHYDSTKPLE